MDVHGLGEVVDGAFRGLKLLAIVAIPLVILGLWKLVEIIMWVFSHVNISIG